MDGIWLVVRLAAIVNQGSGLLVDLAGSPRLYVALEVVPGLGDGITTELLHERVGQYQSDHGFTDHAGRGRLADI